MRTPKMQHCDFCGEELGVFVHVRSLDGPRNCGAAQCNRDERDDERAARDQAQYEAERDDYWRYR